MNDLLTSGKVERKWYGCLLPLPLKLLSDDKVAILVEDELVGERVEEEVILEELVAPGHVEVDQGQGSLFFHKEIHFPCKNCALN